MSGERKNTITKSATANTTTKKGLSQGLVCYLSRGQ